jgi:type IV pilus assembly protein PilE
MIVVAIVAILAAIAIPSYRSYVTRGRITEAVAGLADARTKMEQYFQDNRSYPASCVQAPAAPGANQVQTMSSTSFDFTCTNLSATAYTVSAVGKGPMVGFTYAINEQNLRTSTFSGAGASSGWTAATPNNCWVTRKGGLC